MAPPMITTGNAALIRFISNGAKQDKGFHGYWTTDPNVFPTLPAPPTNPWDDIIIGEPGSLDYDSRDPAACWGIRMGWSLAILSHRNYSVQCNVCHVCSYTVVTYSHMI